MVKYMLLILVSHTNQILINHCTEDVYQFNFGLSHHCSFAVYLCHHLIDPIPLILQTNEILSFLSAKRMR